MPRRWLRIVLFAFAVATAVWIIGLVLFESGGEAPPRTGTGETLTARTTP